MTLHEFFPDHGHYAVAFYADAQDDVLAIRERAHRCASCGALCADKQRHYRWHVDTGATVLLPSDTKGSL